MRAFAGSSRGLWPFAVTLAVLALLVPAASFGAGEIPEIHHAKSDFDARTGTVAPTAAQLSAVEQLGAEARWNRFGTPSSLIDHDGLLATGLAAPSAEAAARSWLASNSAIFGNTTGLALLNDATLRESSGHAVTFRQEFGGVPATQDGLVTVGVTGTAASGWSVAYASSSLTGDSALAGQPQLSAREGWVAAARDAGLDVSLADITSSTTEHGWTVLEADDVEGEQRTRLSAFPTATAGVAPAWETYVLSGLGNDPQAYKTFIDARNGAVLFRESIVEHVHQEQPEAFTGDLPAADGGCGPEHGPYTAPPNTVSVEVVATATVPANDIVLHLKHNGARSRASTAGPARRRSTTRRQAAFRRATYFAQVCDFGDGAPALAPTGYTGTIAMNDVGGDPIAVPAEMAGLPGQSARSAPGNPSTDVRKLWCWDANINGGPIAGLRREVKNSASRAPWDYDVRTSVPTFTTRGNNAISRRGVVQPADARARPASGRSAPTGTTTSRGRTPGTRATAPDQLRRRASATTSRPRSRTSSPCTTACTTGRTTSASPRRTGTSQAVQLRQLRRRRSPRERRRTTRRQRRRAPLTGGSPSFLGRDNANMRPLPDGVSPITNMYLWQPLAGAFYAPCVDGDYDMAVIGHEYGHVIENRMIGKGGTRAGHHAGAMGESNGDLNGDGDPERVRLRAGRGREPVTPSAPTRRGTSSAASATTA